MSGRATDNTITVKVYNWTGKDTPESYLTLYSTSADRRETTKAVIPPTVGEKTCLSFSSGDLEGGSGELVLTLLYSSGPLNYRVTPGRSTVEIYFLLDTQSLPTSGMGHTYTNGWHVNSSYIVQAPYCSLASSYSFPRDSLVIPIPGKMDYQTVDNAFDAAFSCPSWYEDWGWITWVALCVMLLSALAMAVLGGMVLGYRSAYNEMEGKPASWDPFDYL